MNRLGVVTTFSVIAGSAALAALVLGHVGHHDLGLARLTIRHSALIAAGAIGMLLAM
jgi:hypothetical protein